MRNSRLRFCRYLLCLAFTGTLAHAATVITLPATALTGTSATLNATANPGGSSRTGYFEYGFTTSYGTSTAMQSIGNGSSNTNFSQAVTGLTSGRTYHYRAATMTSVFSPIFGGDQIFSLPLLPLAVTGVAAPVHPGQATLNASVDPSGTPVVCWFEHGPTTNYGSVISASTLTGTSFVAISNLLTGLPRGLPYHFRVVASNSVGLALGADAVLTVPQGPTGPSGTNGGGQAFDIRQPALELNFIICTNGFYPAESQLQIPFLGQVGLFAGNFAPAGWVFCQGQLFDISSNTPLFSVFGTTYGGDGLTNFVLPDLRGCSLVKVGQGPGLRSWIMGQISSGGSQVTLQVQNLPAHTHSLPLPDSVTGTNGAGVPYNNLKPLLGMDYLIAQIGFFPVQGNATIFEPFLGQVMMFAGNLGPAGAASVNGQTLSIAQNTALYAVLGTNYGGNGINNFQLPNLQSRVPMGTGQGPVTAWSLGQITGFDNTMITTTQMPAHQHTVPALGILTGFTGGNQPVSFMQGSMALQYLISTNGQIPSVSVQATNKMVGEIQLYAGTNVPVGWLPCDGRLLSITGSPALFGVISNYFGGDHVTTFALPNLSGRIPVGSMTGQPGAVYGAEQVVLTVANLPPHAHSVPVLDFDRWITSFGQSDAAAGFNADADADQAGNGYEWATGSNPTNAQSTAPLTINLAGGNVNLHFPRNTNATDVTFTLLRSTNLANPGAWTGIATNLAGAWSAPALVTETGASNPVNVTLSAPVTNAPAANYRLQIVWP